MNDNDSSVGRNSKGPQLLFRIAGVGAALAFGAMVGSLFAVKRAPGGLTFVLGPAAVAAFLVAASLAWFYWRLIARLAVGEVPVQRKRRFVLFSIGLLIIGIVSFLYPLTFIAPEKRKDVFVGLVLAISCIVGVMFVMWHVKRFLDADLKRSEEADPRSSEEEPQ